MSKYKESHPWGRYIKRTEKQKSAQDRNKKRNSNISGDGKGLSYAEKLINHLGIDEGGN